MQTPAPDQQVKKKGKDIASLELPTSQETPQNSTQTQDTPAVLPTTLQAIETEKVFGMFNKKLSARLNPDAVTDVKTLTDAEIGLSYENEKIYVTANGREFTHIPADGKPEQTYNGDDFRAALAGKLPVATLADGIMRFTDEGGDVIAIDITQKLSVAQLSSSPMRQQYEAIKDQLIGSIQSGDRGKINGVINDAITKLPAFSANSHHELFKEFDLGTDERIAGLTVRQIKTFLDEYEKIVSRINTPTYEFT